MEDVSLVKMNGDECFKLGTLNLSQLFSCHVDQRVKDLLKVVIDRLHNLFVTSSILESFSSC